MTGLDVAWLAGLLEGEGSFYASRDNRDRARRLAVTFASTDEDVVRTAHRVFGIGRVHPWIPRLPRKPYWRWTVAKTEDVAGLCMTIYGLMHARRRGKILDVLSAWRSDPLLKRLRGECVRGHLLSGENMARRRDGFRYCRACEPIRRRALRERRRGAQHAIG